MKGKRVNTQAKGHSNTMPEFASIGELSALFHRKELSPVDVVLRLFERIAQWNVQLNAYITLTREEALAAARASELRYRQGAPRGPLDGIPIAIKDNIWTRGVRTTAGSKFLADFIPDHDATVVERLRRAGAVILGKTNLHEFAYGVTTENPHYGATRNPWDLARICGGSSGGSAAAVAAGLCDRRAGHRYGRLGAYPVLALRRRGPETYLRPRQLLRHRAARSQLRPRGAHRANRWRRSPASWRHGRTRSMPIPPPSHSLA